MDALPQSQMPPVVSIYQNPEHVAGVLQQLFESPLLTNESRDFDRDDIDETKRGKDAGLDVGVKIAVPTFGGANVSAQVGAARERTTTVATASRSTQSFVYSQAYYLNVVRGALRDRSFLRPMTSFSEASDLRVGDFVEYTADFSPSTIPTLLDVLTPELVAAAVAWRRKKTGLAGIDFDDFAGRQAAFDKLNEAVAADAALAHQIAQAVQSDFRQEKTREFYGKLDGVDNVTVVTICDASHFVVEDEDRILDGSYTVLGKVTSRATEDLPVFERNKLLRNIAPDAVDQMIGALRRQLNTVAGPRIDDQSVEQMINFDLSSRVPGAAIRIIPIAVFV